MDSKQIQAAVKAIVDKRLPQLNAMVGEPEKVAEQPTYRTMTIEAMPGIDIAWDDSCEQPGDVLQDRTEEAVVMLAETMFEAIEPALDPMLMMALSPRLQKYVEQLGSEGVQ